jgi:2-polyprenyl-6-methoxyphenol hydroxylase-like FAD-dependent oxidoreductase
VKRAVVAGGGFAGLLAARVLADIADEVILVEPDALPAGGQPRGGVPHGGQVHVLLEAGQRLLEEWFPGIRAELAAVGATWCGLDGEAQMFVDGRPRPAVSPDGILSVSRPLLECVLRRRVLARPTVFPVRARVTGLAVAGDRVAAVRLAGCGIPEHLPADLVVDATGRVARLEGWLRRLGYPPPPRQRVRLDLHYATATFPRVSGQRFDGRLLVHSLRSPGTPRPGVSAIVPLEGDRWAVLLSGYGPDRPEPDLEAFRRRCRLEPLPYFAALVDDCAATGEVIAYRFPGTVRRDWHRLRRRPAGVVVVGDAVAAFNPVYGQGMTVAALHASALGVWLRSGAPEQRFFTYLRVITDAAWLGAAAEDLRLPHAHGDRPAGYLLLRALNAVIGAGSLADPVVARHFVDAVGLRMHPSGLARPALLVRAALGCLRRR